MSKTNTIPPIFVINLKKDIDRKEYISNLLDQNNLAYTIVEGVVPSKQDVHTIYDGKRGFQKFNRDLLQGEIGCAMSHLKIYQLMLDNDIEQAIVMEDDVVLKDNFRHVVSQLNTALPQDWQLVLLGYGSTDGKQAIYHLKCPQCETESFKITKPLTIAYSTIGYLINRQGAQRLLSRINETNQLYMPIDCYTGNYRIVNLYCVKPRCVEVNINTKFESGIGLRLDYKPKFFLKKLKRMSSFIRWLANAYRFVQFKLVCVYIVAVYKLGLSVDESKVRTFGEVDWLE